MTMQIAIELPDISGLGFGTGDADPSDLSRREALHLKPDGWTCQVNGVNQLERIDLYPHAGQKAMVAMSANHSFSSSVTTAPWDTFTERTDIGFTLVTAFGDRFLVMPWAGLYKFRLSAAVTVTSTGGTTGGEIQITSGGDRSLPLELATPGPIALSGPETWMRTDATFYWNMAAGDRVSIRLFGNTAGVDDAGTYSFVLLAGDTSFSAEWLTARRGAITNPPFTIPSWAE